MLLKPLTPAEIVNDSLQRTEIVKVESESERGKNRVIPPSMSERHKPNLSGKKKSEGENLIQGSSVRPK